MVVLFVPSFSSTFGRLIDMPSPDTLIVGAFFSSFLCANSMTVGVVRGTKFVAVAAVSVAGVVARVVCDLMLACGWGTTGAVCDRCVGVGYVNMGSVVCLGLYPLTALSPSAVIWITYIRVSSTSSRLFLLMR